MKTHSIPMGFDRSLGQRTARSRRLLAVFALSLGLTLAVTCLLGAGLRVARAATFTVTTFADDYDGVCDAHCSLRDAIVVAHGNGLVDTISLSKGTYVLTRTGAGEDAGLTGDLDIARAQAITIAGVGADLTTIDATGIDRVLDIHLGLRAGTVVISGVTIYNGNPGAAEGGGIRTADNLVLINTVVVSNAATEGGGVYVGARSVTFSGGQIVSNTATYYGGGVYVAQGRATLSGGGIVSNTAAWYGGGVYVDQATAAFTQTGASTIALNTAQYGGGVCVYSGTATLSGGEIASNTAQYCGGGVYVWYGRATLSGGQIVSNTARDPGSGAGGGVCVVGGAAAFTQTGTSVIARNTAPRGGGVYVSDGRATLSGGQIVSNTASLGGGVYVDSGSATLSGGQIVSNTASLGGGVRVYGNTAAFTQTGASTIALNTAQYGGGVHVYSGTATLSGGQIVSNTAQVGGGLYNDTGTLTLVNSTVSGNKASGSGGGLYSNGGTSVMTFTTVASNTAASGGGGILLASGTVLLQDTIVAYNGTNCNVALTSNGHNLEDGHTCGLDASGDRMDTDPLLGPLTVEGGSLVHPLRAGSPAIDGGVCIAGITGDQRGVTRPQGAACDIGAYESEWVGWQVYLPLVLRNYCTPGGGLQIAPHVSNTIASSPHASRLIPPPPAFPSSKRPAARPAR